MSKNLKKIMITSAALLMLTSVGIGSSNINANARHIRSKRVARIHYPQNNKRSIHKRAAKRNQKHSKQDKKTNTKKHKRNNKHQNKKHRSKYMIKRQRQAKKLTKHARNRKRSKRAKKNQRILKSKFRRSNNPRLLKRSGFYDLRAYGPDIMNAYAPNNHKAVIPKKVNIKDVLWLKGHFLQNNPTVYEYKPAHNGWIRL